MEMYRDGQLQIYRMRVMEVANRCDAGEEEGQKTGGRESAFWQESGRL